MPAAARYFFLFLGDFLRSAQKITKKKKNLLELAKVLILLFKLSLVVYTPVAAK
jgi:hypothetical protein